MSKKSKPVSGLIVSKVNVKKKLHYLHVGSPQEDNDMRLFHFVLFTGECSCMMSPSGCSGRRAEWRPRTGLKSRNA